MLEKAIYEHDPEMLLFIVHQSWFTMFRGKVKNHSVVNHGLDILQTSWLVISLSLKSCFVFTILWAHAFLLLDSGERQEIRGQEMGNDMYYMSSG